MAMVMTKRVSEFIDDKSDSAKRIIKMITSSDVEMVELGLTLLFDNGEKYLINNIPSTGPRTIDEEGIIETSIDNDMIVYTRKGFKYGIRISGIIDCRPIEHYTFPRTIKYLCDD